MGRNPVIRSAVLSVLAAAKTPLRFSEIKQKVQITLNKLRIYDRPIAENLKKLVNDGLVGQVIFKEHLAYHLTNEYYNKQAKTVVESLLQGVDEKTLYADLEQNDPPFVAFVEPFRPIEEKGTSFFVPCLLDWGDVKHVIAARMLEALTELDSEMQTSIAKFLAYAYWCGVKSMVKEPFNKKTIGDNYHYALECIKRAKERGDQKRVETEESIICLLEIATELMSKKNLKDFLDLLQNKKFDVKKLQSKILKNHGQFLGAGEEIFDNFLEFHSCVMEGLYAAELLPLGRKRGSSLFSYRYLVGFSEVWDEFIGDVLSIFLSSDELEEVKEDLSESVNKIKVYSNYLEPLRNLPFKSKICITYLWGYPEIFQVSDKDFLPHFEQWVNALREGNLDHRSWVFKKGEEELTKAFRAVKRGRPPPDTLIDLEPWTLLDLYRYHPRGKEPALYRELIDTVRARKQAV